MFAKTENEDLRCFRANKKASSEPVRATSSDKYGGCGVGGYAGGGGSGVGGPWCWDIGVVTGGGSLQSY